MESLEQAKARWAEEDRRRSARDRAEKQLQAGLERCYAASEGDSNDEHIAALVEMVEMLALIVGVEITKPIG